jgi:hypothetical protein
MSFGVDSDLLWVRTYQEVMVLRQWTRRAQVSSLKGVVACDLAS